jgi:hypothetical protein
VLFIPPKVRQPYFKQRAQIYRVSFHAMYSTGLVEREGGESATLLYCSHQMSVHAQIFSGRLNKTSGEEEILANSL